jgi:hypothetical protein
LISEALRLRELIERAAPLGLFALRPVCLMTSDIASRVLQPRPESSITSSSTNISDAVEYALPSLFRSRIVIVSGDEKQVPPTAFFASKVENDEAAIFDGEEPEEEATKQRARSAPQSRTLQVDMPFKTRRSSTRGTLRGLLGSSGWMTFHSNFVSSQRAMAKLLHGV